MLEGMKLESVRQDITDFHENYYTDEDYNGPNFQEALHPVLSTLMLKGLPLIMAGKKGSRGIVGTLENIDHHAQTAMPFLCDLTNIIALCEFETWKMHHNVHFLETEDGRSISLRPLLKKVKGDYKYGVRIAMKLSRSNEQHLMDFHYRNQVGDVLSLLRSFSKKPKTNHYGAIKEGH